MYARAGEEITPIGNLRIRNLCMRRNLQTVFRVYAYVRPRIRKFPVLKLALPVLVWVPVLVRADPRSR